MPRAAVGSSRGIVTTTRSESVMDDLYGDEPFRDFGPDALAPVTPAPALQIVRGQRSAALRVSLRMLCPDKPGVYGMLDATGQLIYVGKAKSLRARLLSYFRTGSRSPKSGRILRDSRAIAWEVCSHEFAALLREQQLIRRWRPRCNVHGQPLRRRLAFLCVGRAPAPYVFLTRQPPVDAAAFGPVNWTQRTVKAVRRLNDHFRLRDCPQAQTIVFPEQRGLYPLALAPGCVRADLQTCSAPCTGTLPQADYAAQVEAALRFLGGDAERVVATVERRMREAARRQQFECAAVLRDQQADLSWLVEQLARVRQAQETMSFVYPVIGWDGGGHWHLIHGARVLARVPAPVDSSTAEQAVRAVDAVFAGKRLDQLLTPYEHHDGRLIVMQWFRRHPRERKKTLSAQQALGLCRRWLTLKSA
jgi:excinuclease ABC subunit C